jgi:hypothetical protein
MREAEEGVAARRGLESSEAARKQAAAVAESLRNELRETKAEARKSVGEAQDAADKATSAAAASDEALRQAELASATVLQSKQKERSRLASENAALLISTKEEQRRAVEDAVAASDAKHSAAVAQIETAHEREVRTLADKHAEELAAAAADDEARRAGHDAADSAAAAAELNRAHTVAELNRAHTSEVQKTRAVGLHTCCEFSWIYSLEAPGFNPRAYKVENWFQNVLFKWVNLYHYSAAHAEAVKKLMGAHTKVGGLYKLTSSLKAPGSNH